MQKEYRIPRSVEIEMNKIPLKNSFSKNEEVPKDTFKKLLYYWKHLDNILKIGSLMLLSFPLSFINSLLVPLKGFEFLVYLSLYNIILMTIGGLFVDDKTSKEKFFINWLYVCFGIIFIATFVSYLNQNIISLR